MKIILMALALAMTAGCATTPSTAERNKAVARRAFSEILEKGPFEPKLRSGLFVHPF